MAIEIEGTYYLMRAALPGMRERGWGRFISIGGHMADDWRYGPPEAPLDYPLGKAARHWLTRTIAPREFDRRHHDQRRGAGADAARVVAGGEGRHGCGGDERWR